MRRFRLLAAAAAALLAAPPAAAIVRVIRLGRNGRERLYHESYPNMPAFGSEAVFDADGLVNFLKTDLQR